MIGFRRFAVEICRLLLTVRGANYKIMNDDVGGICALVEGKEVNNRLNGRNKRGRICEKHF